MQSLIHGTTFLVVDDSGDAHEGSHGLFAHDTRHLSRWRVLVDGQTPRMQAPPDGPHHRRTFEGSCGTVALRRTYVVDDALHVRLVLQNDGPDAVQCELRVEAAADFLGLLEVKHREFEKVGVDEGEFGVRSSLRGRDEPDAPAPVTGAAGDLVWHGAGAQTFLACSSPPDAVVQGPSWIVQLEPGKSWTCDVRVDWSPADADRAIDFEAHARAAAAHAREWRGSTPRVHGTSPDVARTLETSIDDLGALRIPAEEVGGEPGLAVPAAGLPWFLTLFGRDSLITALQALPLGADLPKAVVATLARLQSDSDDPSADAEPGKILHEVRRGAAARHGWNRYYGSVDSTPLFLILLDEVHRWTGDDGFVVRQKAAALAALEWIERWGDRDGDGYLEYERRTPDGLANQSWKDSWDSQRFHDGTLADGPIAPAEVQGYAYDARRRLARLSRTVWRDEDLAGRLEHEAAVLRERFNRDFWVPPERAADAAPDDARSSGYFALALDGHKRPVDSLCSNIGHLLWSGIVDDDRTAPVARQLVHQGLFSGWGVRTMSTADAGYDPQSYHCGTVWPHDTSLCVAGLARSGAHDAAADVARALFDAAAAFDGRLPEVFAGLPRDEATPPGSYPTTCSPQAWAAAAPVLLLTSLLGIEPDPASRTLRATGVPVPEWLEGLQWEGVNAFDRKWKVDVRAGAATVSEA